MPLIETKGLVNPVVQNFDEQNNEMILALQMKASSFRPFVFKDGIYSIEVGEPDENKWQTFSNVHTIAKEEKDVIQVAF